MLRHLLFLKPKDNSLYQSRIIKRLLTRRSLILVRLSQGILLLSLVPILLTFSAFHPTPVLLYQDVFRVSLLMLPFGGLMIMLLGVGVSVLSFGLRRQVGDMVALSATDAGSYAEALWASLSDTFPYRWVLLALAVGSLAMSYFTWDSLQLEALYGLRGQTWLLVVYPLLLLTHIALLTTFTLFTGIWLSLRNQTLLQAMLKTISVLGLVLLILSGLKFAAFEAMAGSRISPGPSLIITGAEPASIRAASAYNYTIGLTRLTILGDAVAAIVLIGLALLMIRLALRQRIVLEQIS